jgi:hypothetical protein
MWIACHAVFSSNFINITASILNHMKRLFIHTFHLYIMYPVNSNEKRVTVILWHTHMCRMFILNQELGHEGESIISRNAPHITNFMVGVIWFSKIKFTIFVIMFISK